MPPAVFHLIPHTHWDREWYLPQAAFAVRLAAMMDELLPMLEAHPELRFTLDGQTILVEDHLAQRPEARSRIEALVAGGRLAVGPWYVLADEIIPSPASLRRNLELGLADAARLGGAMRVLYSPDAFGHPGWLPGLAHDVGLRWGVVWRGLAGDRTSGPDLRVWTGADGRSILIHHLPPEGYEVGAHLPAAGPGLAEAWRELRDRLLARSLTRHVAVPIGSDHHAPHPDLPRLVDHLRAIDPGHEIRFSRWEDYFEGVEAKTPDPPVVQGELRWSYGYTWTLQGVHASRARLKRRYSTAERWLEVAASLVGRAAGRTEWDRTALLEPLWRRLAQCQFHDTLAGTVSDEAAREQATRLDSVIAAARELARESILGLAGLEADERRAGGQSAAVAITTTGAAGVVALPVDRFVEDVLVGPPDDRRPRHAHLEAGFSLHRPDGGVVPHQVLRRETTLHRSDRRYGYPDLDRVERCWVAVDTGSRAVDEPLVLRVGRGQAAALRVSDPVRTEADSMENAAVRVAVEGDGSITLLDRATGERYSGLLRVVSETDEGDLYTSWAGPTPAVALAVGLGAERLTAGPLIGAFALHWRIDARQGEVVGRTVVALHAGSGLVRCRIDLDNRAWQHRLRLRLPIRGSGSARAGDGTGRTAARPVSGLVSDFPAEWPVPTAPAHGTVSVGEGRRGLTVMRPEFFEYEWGTDGVLQVTLVRSVGALSRDDLPPRPGHAGWPTPTPEAQEPGLHRIELVVGVGADPEPSPPFVIALPLLSEA